MVANESRRAVVSGASGLVGSRLVEHLRGSGYRVSRLVRGGGQPGDVAWDPAGQRIDEAGLEGVDAVVHLAGESIAAGRWTNARKARIRDSRVTGTRLLVDALGRLRKPPRVLLSASAVGYYGDRGDDWLEETAGPGMGFLAEVCRDWEAAAERASAHGIRVVRYRMGLVLASEGGALGRMLPVFRSGLGGTLGTGRHYQSFITRHDLERAMLHGLETDAVSGAVNAVSPYPVTNREFTRVLARVLRRPAVLPVPAFALRVGLGELAGELLSSQRARPSVLERAGFEFEHSELELALRAVLSPG